MPKVVGNVGSQHRDRLPLNARRVLAVLWERSNRHYVGVLDVRPVLRGEILVLRDPPTQLASGTYKLNEPNLSRMIHT